MQKQFQEMIDLCNEAEVSEISVDSEKPQYRVLIISYSPQVWCLWTVHQAHGTQTVWL